MNTNTAHADALARALRHEDDPVRMIAELEAARAEAAEWNALARSALYVRAYTDAEAFKTEAKLVLREVYCHEGDLEEMFEASAGVSLYDTDGVLEAQAKRYEAKREAERKAYDKRYTQENRNAAQADAARLWGEIRAHEDEVSEVSRAISKARTMFAEWYDAARAVVRGEMPDHETAIVWAGLASLTA